MKKHFFLFLLYFLGVNIYTIPIIAQNFQKGNISDYKTFGIIEGFEINNVSSMVFDNDDWLWISGRSLELNGTRVNNRTAIIQRFNGSSFYTVPLPEFALETPNFIWLTKRPDGQFYVVFDWSKESKLFLLNPKTLNFKEIPLPDSLKDKTIKLFEYKDLFFVFLCDTKETLLYELNDEMEFSFLSKTTVGGKGIWYFLDFIGFNDHFVVSEARTGVLLYNKDGSYQKAISLEDLGLSDRRLDYVLKINTWFEQDGITYVQFSESPDYYSYDPDNRTWEKTPIFHSQSEDLHPKLLTERLYTDPKGNKMRHRFVDSSVLLSIYSNDKIESISLPSNIDSFPEEVSRDLERELYVSQKGILYHFTFEYDKVTTFLEGKSIRGLLELSSEKILAATENSGWFILDLNRKESIPLDINQNGDPFIPSQNRNLFSAEEGYWSNYDKGIIHIEKKTGKITSYVHYPIAAMVDDEAAIYYGTHNYNLMRFDKKKRENQVLATTKDYIVQDIVKVNKDIYLATETGLLWYHNEIISVFTPNQNKEDTFLLSLDYNEEYGLLAGSRSGKLFQFDPESKTFNLFYEDELNASIASVLFDDHNRVWINTFRGIVSFDPASKNITRYSINDGLSFYECNRYSALKTTDGHFLVGTLYGLNYFHPDKIEKRVIKANLQLASVTLHSLKEGKELKEIRPNQMNSLESVMLPPENRNFNIQYGLLGIYNAEDITYRYRLNKQAWILMGKRTEIQLLNLSAGKYQLEIEALDSSQSIIGKPIQLNIIAKEFFYKTGWFYFIGSLLLLNLALWYFNEQRKKYALKQHFSTKIINTQEQERSRIAKELHDSIGQKLLIIKNTLFQKNSIKVDEISMLEETIQEVREMAHNLHPFHFEQLGLVKSIENLIHSFQKSSKVFYSCDIEDISGLISDEKEIFIFRMLQECIMNVEKHAEATACNLEVTSEKNMIVFKIKDNGKGFVYNEESLFAKSLGMKSLQERAHYINANFNIDSIVGQGTLIIIKIPK